MVPACAGTSQVVDLATDVQHDLHWFNMLLRKLVAQLERRVAHGLPSTEFPVSRVHDAFQLLKSGGNIGKVVVTSPFTSLVRADLLPEVCQLSLRSRIGGGTSPSPACGEFYEQVASIGPQPVSTKKTVSAFAFGHQPRAWTRHGSGKGGSRASDPPARKRHALALGGGSAACIC